LILQCELKVFNYTKKEKSIYIIYIMLKWVKELILSTIILLILDFIYISVNMRAFEEQIALIQRVVMQVRIEGAIICYLLLIFGLNYFIISRNRPVLDAFLFGFVIYGVYDSTNYAMLKKWSPYLAIMDALWGGTLMALTTLITYSVL